MSLAELLPAIRALPQGEKVQLVHLLVDELGGKQPSDDGIPERLRHLIPPAGATLHPGWQVTLDKDSMRAAHQLLSQMKGTA